MTPRSPEPPGALGPAVELPVPEEPLSAAGPFLASPFPAAPVPGSPALSAFCSGARCPPGATGGLRARRAENASIKLIQPLAAPEVGIGFSIRTAPLFCALAAVKGFLPG